MSIYERIDRGLRGMMSGGRGEGKGRVDAVEIAQQGGSEKSANYFSAISFSRA